MHSIHVEVMETHGRVMSKRPLHFRTKISDFWLNLKDLWAFEVWNWSVSDPVLCTNKMMSVNIKWHWFLVCFACCHVYPQICRLPQCPVPLSRCFWVLGLQCPHRGAGPQLMMMFPWPPTLDPYRGAGPWLMMEFPWPPPLDLPPLTTTL